VVKGKSQPYIEKAKIKMNVFWQQQVKGFDNASMSEKDFA
jgi:hypothetical protein